MAKSSHRHNSNPDSDSQTDPLQTQKPHELVPFLELETFSESPSRDINQVPSPRVFNTHLPYSILPEAVKNSGRRIIYISRNPADNIVSTWHFYNKRFGTKITLEVAFDEFCQGTVGLGPADTFVSTWHFYNKRFGTKIPLEVAFDEFCQGTVGLGPFVDRVFEYWLEREKENVLFVTYEELKDDPNKHVSRIAEFLGCSLGADEIDQVVWKCSHERLS